MVPHKILFTIWLENYVFYFFFGRGEITGSSHNLYPADGFSEWIVMGDKKSGQIHQIM